MESAPRSPRSRRGAWVARADAARDGEDRKYAIVVEGHDEPVGFTALYGLGRQTAPELGALIGDDVRGKGVGRRAEALTIAKAFERVRRPPGLRADPRPQRGRQAGRHQPRLAPRGDDALAPAPRRELTDCEVWGVLPDEFRAAAADLLE